MSKKHRPSPNDQRSVVKEPGTPAFEADRANRLKLGHPDVPPPAQPKQPATSPTGPKK